LYPGETSIFNIKTDPGSLCTLTSVDKSSTIIGSWKSLSVDQLLVDYIKEREPTKPRRPACVFRNQEHRGT